MSSVAERMNLQTHILMCMHHLAYLIHSGSGDTQVVYSQFLNLVKQGSVRSVRMEETGGKAYFDVKAPGLDAAADGNVGDGARSWENGRVRGGHEYVTKCIDDPNLIPVLIAAGVEFGAVKVGSLSLHYHASV